MHNFVKDHAVARILVIDNYDSFTYNLVQYLAELDCSVSVYRNDAIAVDDVTDSDRWDGVLLSPGPGSPDDAGVCLEAVAACAEARMPLLGVCLGHQTIVQAFGGVISHAKCVMHGKTSAIEHNSRDVFAGLPNPLTVVRYHSLAAIEADVPEQLEVTARAADGEIMGVAHKQLPISGVQFHPESIASEHGHAMLKNWIDSFVTKR